MKEIVKFIFRINRFSKKSNQNISIPNNNLSTLFPFLLYNQTYDYKRTSN